MVDILKKILVKLLFVVRGLKNNSSLLDSFFRYGEAKPGFGYANFAKQIADYFCLVFYRRKSSINSLEISEAGKCYNPTRRQCMFCVS